MAKKLTLQTAVTAINQYGALLVFPANNEPLPPSLWSVFHTGKKMDWDWSSDGDSLVPQLWHLRTELAVSNEVVYTKWFQGRATVFSKELFTRILSTYSSKEDPLEGVSDQARIIYSVLMDDSPLPTKELKARVREESDTAMTSFDRSMKELWRRCLVVGYGEVEEGGFPSLAVGVTKNLFEELWDDSLLVSETNRTSQVAALLPAESPFLKAYKRQLRAEALKAS